MGKLIVLISGVLFGAGVTISGMVNPMKVLNFLDISGSLGCNAHLRHGRRPSRHLAWLSNHLQTKSALVCAVFPIANIAGH